MAINEQLRTRSIWQRRGVFATACWRRCAADATLPKHLPARHKGSTLRCYRPTLKKLLSDCSMLSAHSPNGVLWACCENHVKLPLAST